MTGLPLFIITSHDIPKMDCGTQNYSVFSSHLIFNITTFLWYIFYVCLLQKKEYFLLLTRGHLKDSNFSDEDNLGEYKKKLPIVSLLQIVIRKIKRCDNIYSLCVLPCKIGPRSEIKRTIYKDVDLFEKVRYQFLVRCFIDLPCYH